MSDSGPSYSDCNEVSAACPVEATLYGYYPTLWVSALFAAIFALNLIVTLGLGLYSRLWSFQGWLTCGLIWELVGYIGRLMMRNDPWSSTAMQMQLVCLFLGPSFISAAISVVVKHIILYCGQRHSKLKAKWYPYVFIGTDFGSILIQVAGGAVSSIATTGENPSSTLLDAGSGLLIAGVASQAANMIVCGGIIAQFMWTYKRQSSGSSAASSQLDTSTAAPYDIDRTNPRMRLTFRAFVSALTVAYVAILIRCIYRIPEMALGWGSTLMQNETTFLILDGLMIIISACLCTAAYPGLWFPPMRRGKKQTAMPVQDQ